MVESIGAAAVIGGFVATAMILYRLVDFLITKYTGNNNNVKDACAGKCVLDANMQEMINI